MNKLFNNNWLFAEKPLIKEQMEDTNGAIFQKPENFKDNAESLEYHEISIPHDWMISNTNELYRNSIGFYKKDFTLETISNLATSIRFEGVYMNSAVYINGTLAGTWQYGYTTFEFDITNLVKKGKNTIQVICVYQSPNSRWYSGAGIFRDVYLLQRNLNHFISDGIYIVNEKDDNNSWNMNISAETGCKDPNCSVRHTILDTKGIAVATGLSKSPLTLCSAKDSESLHTIISNKEKTSYYSDVQTIKIQKPQLWDIENPYCYTVVSELLDTTGTVVDTVKQHTGFRTIRFDADKGFFLNDRHIKIHGACQHHDLGALGAAFDIHAVRRQFAKLKKMGVNSIRTSHNPQAPAFMDLADEMGILINDECFDMWEKPKTTYDYGIYFPEEHSKDCAAWVRRDRNHPSLIMWSIGNEIYDTHFPRGIEVTKDLKATVEQWDPEKNGFVTIGSNYMPGEGAQNCANEIDCVGYNYAERLYSEHHTIYSSWKLYGSETASTVQSRGIYHFPYSCHLLTFDDQQCSSLGNCTTTWGALSSADAIIKDRDAPMCAGQYIWTGWDYIGEPTPYFTKNSYFGQIDTAGFEKDTYYQYKAEWTNVKDEPFIHILPYWDFNEGQLIDIRVYSNASDIELFFNNTSLGHCSIDHLKGQKLAGEWQLPYEKGTLKACAYDSKGNIIAEDIQKSFDDPAKLVITPETDCNTGNLHFIQISTQDKNGTPVANARNFVTTTIIDGAELIGMDNGDSTDYDQYQAVNGKVHTRKLFSNKLLAVIKTKHSKEPFSALFLSEDLSPVKLSFDGTNYHKQSAPEKEISTEAEKINHSIPVRKIELQCTASRNISKENKQVIVTARIFPENATYSTFEWKAMRLEGIESDSAEIKIDGNKAVITGVSDGVFRLRCTCTNDRKLPEIMSELEFDVSGLGKLAFDPYKIITACKYSSCLTKPKLSFKGGIFTEAQRNFITFDKIDFGTEGSDKVTIPVFSFDTELPVELWDGTAEGNGTCILKGTYKAPSTYNVYTPNTFPLSRRLFGIHKITLVTYTSLSVQGLQFIKSAKAFSKLMAIDHTSIIGDAFICTEEAVTGIGNNVVLEFSNMNFGTEGASKIRICGKSNTENNSINIKFAGENSTETQTEEFSHTTDYEEREYNLKKVTGKQTVSFIFLPGSNFDFKWFQFLK